ncbi:MAG TPA: alkaline phosphatase family protein [Thermoanaerobaculia bacterium]|nr:alkaline phosphatase family protein [Thermoanaerobaculia bacterium]
MAKPLTDAIEHVVVLMLENRSFDNVLGGLYPDLTKQGLYRGLLGNETNPRDPANPRAGSVKVFQGPATSSIWIMPYPDPGELYADMVQQIFGSNASVLPSGVLPPMSGFAWNYTQQKAAPPGAGWPAVKPVAKDIMQYYSGASMPVTSCLAQGYAVCDYWFAAAPVQTLANRVLAHCGTPSKMPGTNLSRIDNPDYAKDLDKHFPPRPPVTDKTIFELLDEANPDGVSPCSILPDGPAHLNWKVYYHDVPLSVLCQYVYQHWCFSLDRPFGGNVFHFHDYDGLGRGTNFENDIKAHQLPKYSFIEPRYSNFFFGTVNSNHPGGAGLDCDDPNGDSLPPPVNVMDGERLLWEVYSILRRHPETFAKTLLIVTYDEHGGLFDHVPPPSAVSPFETPVDNFNYDRYGVRVPAILINPSIKPRTVYPKRQGLAPVLAHPFDHTSILSTLIAQFGLSDSLTPRVHSAPKLEDLITANTYPPPQCAAPEPAPETSYDAPPARPPRVSSVPTGAHSLAGVLCWLYNLIHGEAAKKP